MAVIPEVPWGGDITVLCGPPEFRERPKQMQGKGSSVRPKKTPGGAVVSEGAWARSHRHRGA